MKSWYEISLTGKGFDAIFSILLLNTSVACFSLSKVKGTKGIMDDLRE